MKNCNVVALIVAAGKGKRMGKNHNKLLLRLGTRTIVEHSIEVFLTHPKINKIFLTVSSKDRSFFEKLIPEDIVLVEGGRRRQDSVHNALLKIMQEKSLPEIVLVHDAARPFCSKKLIDSIIVSARKYGAAIPISPIVDTIRLVKKGKTEVLDRSELYSVQTPQGFHTKLIQNASILAIEKKWEVTDDAALIEKIGGSVNTVKGEPQNLKITTPADFERAKYILNSKNLSRNPK